MTKLKVALAFVFKVTGPFVRFSNTEIDMPNYSH